MDPPAVRYVERDGHALAYQVVGAGAADVVWLFEINMHLDLMWTDPQIHYLMERGSTFARTVYFQQRGLGLSDPVEHLPTLEEQADDLVAIMDEVGMRRAVLVGVASASGAVALVAARSPDRVSGLVLIQPFAERLLGGGHDPEGWTGAERDAFVTGWRAAAQNWGSGATVPLWDPQEDSPFNRRLMAMLERSSATPTVAQAHMEWIFRLDFSDTLSSVQCPARIVLVPGSPVPVPAARYVADHIPRGSFHLLPPSPPGASLGEAWKPIIDHVEQMATGGHPEPDAGRFLASVLFTDVVGSTEVLARIGDGAYRDLRAAHEWQVRDEVEKAGGRVLNVAGDGTFSIFDGPASAVHCARCIVDGAEELGLEVRAGVHTGQVERNGPDVSGMTVHVGARIAATAGPGEVLVSRTVRDLVVGSGLRFADAGEHDLKGVPDRWTLYSLTDAAHAPRTLPRRAPKLGMIDQAILRTAKRAPQALRALVGAANARQRRLSR
ncbi:MULTISPECIES: adenylate/guanylate cyclase domain-containing protein [unclassified Rhodococcus (in: high G+C Gram-positive bacteria)]|uniref:adenylate/guanylate cyclase domain-containing protein n=1 Tax=unclassified Rhodococcus (in: high G+C Gram-positive bacteria) TaxID=192944 RepID=UPI00163974C1|nr:MULTISPECIES: adenylate/guanylate cyclase domain-containing protein [unclassified Rhodococcus (in: high G+C Gram-positive bacteria)]MBC2641323.1 adenylate/guanylate cyclase domain-containing protein [Rhodococcus sp. 3A]MBC2893932.1 adenylate/guanylate cyclase domain-containing protein [Rhodococcus sp. 4CII]